MGYQDEVRARRKRQKVQNIQTYLTNPDLIAQRLGRLGVETPLPALPAATGSGRIYKPTPNLGTMIAGGAPAPTAVAAPPMPAPLVGLRPGQRATAGPAPYEQMIAGRGYAEPISPMGAYNRREATATVPGANPPILYSPETEAIADRIMAEEQAAFAERNRWRRMAAENLKAVQSPAQAGYSFGFQGDVPTAQVSGLDAAGRPAVMMPTRLAPRPEEPPAETPTERVARIQQAIAAGTMATQQQTFDNTGQTVMRAGAGPGEVNPLTTYTLDVARAMAGEPGAVMPRAYRPPPASAEAQAKLDQARMERGLARSEPITPEQRQAKRQTEMDIRSRIAESNRVGRPITRQQAAMMAQLEGKVNRGEELTPMETISTMSPEQQARLGPEGFAAIMESDPKRLQVAERTARSQAAFQAIAAIEGKGGTASKRLYDIVTTGAEVDTAGGGAPVPPNVDVVTRIRDMIAQNLPALTAAFDRALMGGDEAEVSRLARLAGATPDLADEARAVVRSTRTPRFTEQVEAAAQSPWSPPGAAANLANLVRGVVMPAPTLPGVSPAALARLRILAKTDPEARRVLQQILAAERAAAPQRRWWK